MLRLCLGVVLVGLVAATQAAEFDEDIFAPELNLFTTQPVHSGFNFMLHYQFSASVVFIRSPDTALTEPALDSTFQLPFVAQPQQETTRATPSYWQQAYDGNRISLQRLLSVEFKGERANITFRPRSVLIEGEQFRITFRSQSALIERERLKILFQPHSASLLWNKMF